MRRLRKGRGRVRRRRRAVVRKRAPRVTTYGAASVACCGRPRPWRRKPAASARPKSSAASSTPTGAARPSMTATTAIQPRPAVMFSENNVTLPRASWAPASPHSTPETSTAAYWYLAGLTPERRRRVRRLADPAQPEPPHVPGQHHPRPRRPPPRTDTRAAVKPPTNGRPGEGGSSKVPCTPKTVRSRKPVRPTARRFMRDAENDRVPAQSYRRRPPGSASTRPRRGPPPARRARRCR